MNGELKNSVLRVTVSISCKDFQHQMQNEKLTKKQMLKIEKAKTYEQLILQIEFLIKGIDNHVEIKYCLVIRRLRGKWYKKMCMSKKAVFSDC